MMVLKVIQKPRVHKHKKHNRMRISSCSSSSNLPMMTYTVCVVSEEGIIFGLTTSWDDFPSATSPSKRRNDQPRPHSTAVMIFPQLFNRL